MRGGMHGRGSEPGTRGRRIARWSRHVLGAAMASALAGSALGAEPIDTALYASLLDRHTRSVESEAGTLVDYRGLARSPEWKRLVASLAQADPAALATREDKLAFWINVYNILAIDLVANAYPVESIRDIGSFFRPVWKKTAGNVGGRNVTLDDVEHGILRPMGEPRIHAAIVCASTSCPSLRREPYLAARLEAQLDDAMGRFVADRRKGVRVDHRRKVLWLSRIFEWFAEDFTERGDVQGYVAAYLRPVERGWLAHRPDIEVRYFEYDWALNDLGDRDLGNGDPGDG